MPEKNNKPQKRKGVFQSTTVPTWIQICFQREDKWTYSICSPNFLCCFCKHLIFQRFCDFVTPAFYPVCLDKKWQNHHGNPFERPIDVSVDFFCVLVSLWKDKWDTNTHTTRLECKNETTTESSCTRKASRATVDFLFGERSLWGGHACAVLLLQLR